MPQGNENQTTTTTEAKPQGQGAANQGQKKAKTKAKKQGQPKKEKQPRQKKERPPREKPAHMSKVDKVAAQLPPLSPDLQTIFSTALLNLSTADMNALVAHLNIEIRRRGVRAIAQGASTGTKLEPGSRVRVKSGHPRFQGQTGTVSKVQRIRCYVRLDGRNKDDYFFIADVEPAAGASTQGNLAQAIQRLSSVPAQTDISTIEDEEESAGPATKTG